MVIHNFQKLPGGPSIACRELDRIFVRRADNRQEAARVDPSAQGAEAEPGAGHVLLRVGDRGSQGL